eukprot:5928358-Pyramimonas_sp.AAC.1
MSENTLCQERVVSEGELIAGLRLFSDGAGVDHYITAAATDVDAGASDVGGASDGVGIGAGGVAMGSGDGAQPTVGGPSSAAPASKFEDPAAVARDGDQCLGPSSAIK